jgi:hypothetical protein
VLPFVGSVDNVYNVNPFGSTRYMPSVGLDWVPITMLMGTVAIAAVGVGVGVGSSGG